MPCSTKLLRPSPSPLLTSLRNALSAALLPKMLTWIVLASTLLGVMYGSGCGRVVLVSEAAPVRTGPNVTGKIYTMIDGEWTLSPNDVDIPEGFYVLSPMSVDGASPQ